MYKHVCVCARVVYVLCVCVCMSGLSRITNRRCRRTKNLLSTRLFNRMAAHFSGPPRMHELFTFTRRRMRVQPPMTTTSGRSMTTATAQRQRQFRCARTRLYKSESGADARVDARAIAARGRLSGQMSALGSREQNLSSVCNVMSACEDDRTHTTSLSTSIESLTYGQMKR